MSYFHRHPQDFEKKIVFSLTKIVRFFFCRHFCIFLAFWFFSTIIFCCFGTLFSISLIVFHVFRYVFPFFQCPLTINSSKTVKLTNLSAIFFRLICQLFCLFSVLFHVLISLKILLFLELLSLLFWTDGHHIPIYSCQMTSFIQQTLFFINVIFPHKNFVYAGIVF